MHLRGADVRVHDPKAIANAKARFPTLNYCDGVEEACRNVDLVVLATEWDDYLNLDPGQLRSTVRIPRLLDTRNAIDRDYWSGLGWQVYALGRGRLGE
jgi:UDPglucose 6-dehydrogenase